MGAVRVAVVNTVLANGGDAAILFGILRALGQATGGDLRALVLDDHPATTAPLYPGLDVRPSPSAIAWPPDASGVAARVRRRVGWEVGRRRALRAARALGEGQPVPAGAFAAPLAALAEAQAVVSTGGTYLAGAYWLGPRLLTFDLVRATRRPYALYTQSVGPFSAGSPVDRLAEVFRGARVTLVRDERSRREVAAVAPGAKTQVRADAAFALADPGVLAAAARRAWPSQPTVAVSVRDWPHFKGRSSPAGMARYRASVAAVVAHLVRQHGARVRFLSTCQGTPGYRYDDSAVALDTVALLPDDVRARVEVDRQHHTPGEILAAYGAADLVLATRMHAAILALCAGTPALPVAYEFKTAELFGALGLAEWVTDIETVTPHGFVQTTERVLAALPAARAGLFAGVEAMRADAMQAGALVAEALV